MRVNVNKRTYRLPPSPRPAATAFYAPALALLAFAVQPAARAQDMPFDLQAADVAYDMSSSSVVASGDAAKQVEVSGTQGILQADKVVYRIASNTVSAEGNVTFTDTASNTLRINRIDITGDLVSGTGQALKLSMPVLGEVAKASDTIISGTDYILHDVEYSPCKNCPGSAKPWTISANTMVYDASTSNVTYNNAVFDVYGVPVMYLPWFRHSVGPQQPKSGVLPPMFAKSTRLGDEMTLRGYAYSASENADYTFGTRLMSSRGAQLLGERRQVGLDSLSEIRGTYLNDVDTGKIRNNLNIIAQKDFSAGQRIGVNAEVASDDTYLNQYFDREDPYLASTLYGEDAGPQHYAALSMTHYQDLNPTRDPARTPTVLPRVQLERWLEPELFGGQLDLAADVTGLDRDIGDKSRRFIGSADYRKPVLMQDGSKITMGVSGRIDYYDIDDYTAGKDRSVARILPETTLTWEKPYISADGDHTIGPIVMAALSPRGGNLSNKVPNDDSVAYELDMGNLFEPSRFAGLDRVETGPRLVYGLDNRWGDAERTRWRVFAGQSLRKYNDTSLPSSGGASTPASDWVGLLEANPFDWVSFHNSFRLDNSNFMPRRSDTGLRIGYLDSYYLNVTHSFLDDNSQEVDSQARIPLTDTLAFESRTRHDLANSKLLLGQGGLVWTRDCYQLELMARRKGYTNGDIRPGTDYLLNIQLLSLGSDEGNRHRESF